MSVKSLFSAGDMQLLRKPAIIFALSAMFSVLLWYGTAYVREQALAAVTVAQGIYEQTSTSVTQIAQEEETIIRYIGRYREMMTEGVVGDPDRLVLLEEVGTLRERLKLYSLAVSMSEQVATRLEYDPYDSVPGEPVDLLSTALTIGLPLLDEEDLTRLVSHLMDSGDLLLPKSCEMRADGGINPDFRSLGEHLSASCTMLWYTFDLIPEVVADVY